MRQWLAIIAVLTGVLFPASGSLHGHHSVAANFDSSSSLEITGTVKEIDIRNPHSQITLDVAESGEAVEWFVEWSDKNALVRRKVDYDRLEPGSEVTITVWPSRRLSHVGYFRQAVLSDGTILRDCGFRAFRDSLANQTEFECE